jgi:hypothetical protein
VTRLSSYLPRCERPDLAAVVDEEVIEEGPKVDEGLPPILGGGIAMVVAPGVAPSDRVGGPNVLHDAGMVHRRVRCPLLEVPDRVAT